VSLEAREGRRRRGVGSWSEDSFSSSESGEEWEDEAGVELLVVGGGR